MRLDNFVADQRPNPRIALITACGAKKKPQPMEAYRVYRSSRIKAVYNRRGDSDMYILSAEYGLVGAHEKIEPYERVMDEERAKELVPQVAERLSKYDYVIFFKGGARKAYLSCVNAACENLGKPLITSGYAFMGGINDIPKIGALVRKGDWKKIRQMEHVEIKNL